MLISGEGGALPMCVPPLRRASPPEGDRMSFCDQMAAAIDGARTLTRLDHLSRSIWQGLAAGAVADADAQALAHRPHAPGLSPGAPMRGGASSAARSSRWVFRSGGPRSSHPDGCKGLPSVQSRLPG